MKLKIYFFTFVFLISQFNLVIAQENKSGDSDQIETDKDPENKNTPKVLPALALTPQAILGTLALAVGMGIITSQQNRDLTARMNRGLDELSDSTRRQIDEIVARVRERENKPPAHGRTERVNACKGGPKVCCQEFFDKHNPKRSNSSMAGETKEHWVEKAGKLMCCLQWDFTHGVWEIFDPRGIHKGERSCQDLNDDPCARTGNLDIAKPQSHKPRGGRCG